MNKNELKVAKRYESQGWCVLHGGAPDFLAVRVENGRIIEFKFVEAKSKRGRLTYEQAVWREVLLSLGARYGVETSTRTNPYRPVPCQSEPGRAIPDRTIPSQSNQTKGGDLS